MKKLLFAAIILFSANAFAQNISSGISGFASTGSGPVARQTSPVFITPDIGTAGGTSLTAGQFFAINKAGSDTAFTGPFLALQNAAGSQGWYLQFGGSNTFDIWNYTASAATKYFNLTTGGLNITGTVDGTTGFTTGGLTVYPSLRGTTGSIGGGALLAGACASGTVAITNSTTTMTVSVSPNTYPGDGNTFYGYVSSNGTVTVKVCGIIAGTPTASTYNVRVLQ